MASSDLWPYTVTIPPTPVRGNSEAPDPGVISVIIQVKGGPGQQGKVYFVTCPPVSWPCHLLVGGSASWSPSPPAMPLLLLPESQVFLMHQVELPNKGDSIFCKLQSIGTDAVLWIVGVLQPPFRNIGCA